MPKMLSNPNIVPLESRASVRFMGKKYPGFYVSYNDVDTSFYGSATTALVLGQMQWFFILNGDHREGYRQCFNGGFFACYAYFLRNLDRINFTSDLIEEHRP